MSERPAPGTLYVVATPIGNLSDICGRALEVLGAVDLIAAEDTRVTLRLLTRYGISRPMKSFREQNAEHMLPALIRELEEGKCLALVTDAGTPSISDPGYTLVAAAHEAGLTVVPIPGPSALATAISACGLNGDGVRFLGFLPRSGPRRHERLASLATETALTVLYESPSRLAETLAELAAACPDRHGAVLRELTKFHEEIARDTLAALAARFAGGALGEIVIAIEGADLPGAEDELTQDTLAQLVRAELAKGLSTKDVASMLSSSLGLPRKRIYELALSLLRG